MQLPGLFKLLTITLSFPSTTSRQEHVLGVAVYVFLPMSKPGDGLVVLNLVEMRLISFGGSSKKATAAFTFFQLPGMFGTGIGLFSPMLITISSGARRN